MPQIALSADFLIAFSRIPQTQQKKVREFLTRFQIDPTIHSINYEPIHDMRDSRVRTVRIGIDYRAIVLHPDQGDVYLLAWVDHHDEAMAWAKHKRFEINPLSGAFQIYDTELITEQMDAAAAAEPLPSSIRSLDEYKLFETFPDSDLMRTGLPGPLLPAIRALDTPADLDKLQPYLPEEVYEALYWVANLGYSIDQAVAEAGTRITERPVDTQDLGASLTNPATLRRITIVNNADELTEMLNQPLAHWRVFLHPSQYNLVHRNFNGPARVLGGAGTGKTVVAMHRARYLAATVFTKPTDRILFTTYTRNLAHNILENLRHLCGPEIERIEVVNLHSWAVGFLRSQGFAVDIASQAEIEGFWQEAIGISGSDEWDNDFYSKEWEQVVQAQGITSKADYLRARRVGQSVSLTRPQRAVVWDVMETYKRNLTAFGKMEWADVIREARLLLQQKGHILPYRAVIVDETQDLFPEEFRLLRQIVPEGENDLFFVGDAHQRIYGRAVAMNQYGINIRGRARKLRINYRTTEEIRKLSVSILTNQPIDDLDGGQDDHKEYISLRNGTAPTIKAFLAQADEIAYVVETITDLVTADVPEETICLVARTKRLLESYKQGFAAAGLEYLLLDRDTPEDSGRGVRLATMHRVKGLEFPHVFLVAVNEGTLPYSYNTVDPFDDEYILQERCLLHVATSRARDTLTITGYGKLSTFIH